MAQSLWPFSDIYKLRKHGVEEQYLGRPLESHLRGIAKRKLTMECPGQASMCSKTNQMRKQ